MAAAKKASAPLVAGHDARKPEQNVTMPSKRRARAVALGDRNRANKTRMTGKQRPI